MKITYDLEYLPERRKKRKGGDAVESLKVFLAGSHRNMCLEFEDEKTAKRHKALMLKFRNYHELQSVFDVYHRENRVYVVRMKKGGKG